MAHEIFWIGASKCVILLGKSNGFVPDATCCRDNSERTTSCKLHNELQVPNPQQWCLWDALIFGPIKVPCNSRSLKLKHYHIFFNTTFISHLKETAEQSKLCKSVHVWKYVNNFTCILCPLILCLSWERHHYKENYSVKLFVKVICLLWQL